MNKVLTALVALSIMVACSPVKAQDFEPVFKDCSVLTDPINKLICISEQKINIFGDDDR